MVYYSTLLDFCQYANEKKCYLFVGGTPILTGKSTIIHQMRLTIAEEETLNYYMAGLGFVEIAQMQNVNNTTVWCHRKSIQKKYLRYVVMQG